MKPTPFPLSARALVAALLLASSTPLASAARVPAQAEPVPAQELEALFERLAPPGIDELLQANAPIPTLDELLAPIDTEFEPGARHFTPLRIDHYQSLAMSGQPSAALRLAIDDSWTQLESAEPTTLELASSLFALAHIQRGLGDWPSAERAYCATIPVLRSLFGPEHPELANCWINLGAARMVAGDFERAGACARMGMGILRRIQDPHGAWLPNGLQNLGMVYGAEGDFEQARRLLEAALEHWRTHGGSAGAELGGAAFELARILRQTGELERAEALMRESLAARRASRPPGHPVIAQSLAGLAAVRRDRGDLAEAEALYRDALRQFREALGPDHPEVSIVASNLGVLLADRGELGEAALLLESVVPAFRASELRSQLVTALNNLAHVYALGTRKPEAEALFREAIELYGELYGSGDPQVAIAKASLSTLLLDRGELETAEQLAREALALSEAAVGDASTLVADLESGLAGVLHARGALEEADQHASRAVRLHESLTPSTNPHVAGALARLGSIRLDRELYTEAGDLLGAALERLEELRERVPGAERERALFAGRFELADLAAELITARLGAGADELALDAAERRSGRAMLDLVLRVNRTRLESDAPNEALALCLAEEGRVRSELLAAEAAFERAPSRDQALKDISLARLAVRQAETKLLAAIAEDGPDPRPARAAVLLAGLDPGEALLYVVWSQPSVTVLLLRKSEQLVTGVQVAETSSAIEALEVEALALGEALSRSPNEREPGLASGELLERLRDLGARLFPRELLDRLDDLERVVVVADGPLVGLPFDALLPTRRDAARAPLRVSYAPSGTVYLRQRAARRSAERGASASALVLGDPSFRSTETKPGEVIADSALDAVRLFGVPLEALPGTRAEAQRVAETLRKSGVETSLLLGSDASLGRLESQLASCRVLHLATHGLPGSPARPYDASLALAAPERASAEDFGFLTLDHMLREWAGKLVGCELVVISACDSSRVARIGDSLMALPSGFFHAGAPTVVASLWRVDDAAGAILMQRFYESWTGQRGEALAPGAALDEAKAWLRGATRRELRAYAVELPPAGASREPGARPAELNGTVVRPETLTPYADPYYWAGFVLIGAPD